VTNLTELTAWRFQIRYDDGFIAWLNGEEVARRHAPDPAAWNSLATDNHPDAEALVPDEIDLGPFVDRLVTGTNWLAIQGFNVTVSSSDFLIEPVLTAERTTGGQAVWRYFVQPTPGGANRGGGSSVGPLLREVAHRPPEPAAGEALLVTARVVPTFTEVGSVVLRYRVMFGAEVELTMRDDGSSGDGAAGDGVFGAAIPAGVATAGQMIRYIVLARDADGQESRAPLFLDPLDSEAYRGTVVADPSLESRLPVVHLFVENVSASESRSGTRCSLFHAGELYDNVEIRVHGQSSAGFPKKGHNLDFPRDHRFLARTNLARVKDLKLMTNWGDKARVRNTLAYEFIAAAGSVGHFAWPVRVQRNGQFHAILDLMEDGDDRWMERVGRDPEGALYKVYDSLASAGGSEKKTRRDEGNGDLQTLINALAESRPLADRVRYAYDNLDLPQTVSYFVALALISSQDHGHKNFYVYRDTPNTGEWMILPWDVDLSWGRNWIDAGGYFTDSLYQNNTLTFYNSAQQGKPGNRLYNLVFQHPDFRRMVLRRLRTVMDTLLLPTGTSPDQMPIENRIRELVNLLDPLDIAASDAELDFQKWGSWGNGNATRAEAQRIIGVHLPGRRTFLFTNPAATINGEGLPASQPTNAVIRFGSIDFNPASGNQAAEYVALTNAEAFAVDVSDWVIEGAIRHVIRPGTVIPAGGTLHVSPNVPAFRARPASPRGGESRLVQGAYRGQLSARGETLDLRDAVGGFVDSLTYAGEPTPAQQSLRVTEVMFNPAPPPAASTNTAQDFEFVELQNIVPSPLNLAGIRFVSGILFDFSGGAIGTLAPDGFVLVVKNRAAFEARYGPGLPLAGEYQGNLDNSSEVLRLDDAVGEKVLEFAYDDTWAPAADGRGRSLVVANPKAGWTAWTQAAQWRASAVDGGSPGRADDADGDPDSDQDGMPDAWEETNRLDPQTDDAGLDADGDGASNLAEYLAGTDPQDRASVLRLSVTSAPGRPVILSFIGVAGREYRVFACDRLPARPWTVVAEYPTRATTAPIELLALTPVDTTRFYRVEVQRPN
ncbi:MAG: CotH kinase family protein, partial [Limisphaerales bacterium]